MISTHLKPMARTSATVRGSFVPALLAAAVLLGASGPISIRVNLNRSSYDLLGGLAITISVDNRTSGPLLARFPTSNLYDIQVLSRKTVVWDYAAANHAVVIAHTREIAPHLTTLGTYVWNETVGGRSVAPGVYTLRVRLLDERYAASERVVVRFAPPLPIAALSHFAGKDQVTTAGSVVAKGTSLRDGSGSIALSRRLPAAPQDRSVVVRGYVVRLRSGALLLEVMRSAPFAPMTQGLPLQNNAE